MGLLEHFSKTETPAEYLPTADALAQLGTKLEALTGYKYLKGERCLRLRIDSMVFDILIFSSKHNSIEDVVDVQCEFRIWARSLDKTSTVHSELAGCPIKPDGGQWYSIATQDELDAALADIKKKIEALVYPVVEQFESSLAKGLAYISSHDVYGTQVSKYRVAALAKIMEQNQS